MRKCHYTYDKEAGKVLIPGCMAVAVSGDLEDCTCRLTQTFTQFEKERYNQILKEKNEDIKGLEIENARLNRIIKKIYKI